MTFLDHLRIKDDEFHGYETSRWINPDIAPLPPSRRTWNTINYLGFWGVAALSISNWQSSSSLLSLGFSVGEAMGVIIIAKFLLALLALSQGWIGAEWHIGYTVSQRITMGMYGSYVGLTIRIVLSFVWYGAQAWLGGLCVSVILSSWSHSFFTMKNTMPESAHMVTRDFVGFVIFHVLSVPCMFIRPENVRNPVAVANIITFFVMMSICIWATVKGGTGPLIHQGAAFTAMPKGWAWLYGISSGVGGVAAGVLNQSDYTRFARKQGVQIYGTLFALFILGIIVPVFAILTGSATITIYGGEAFWNPLTIVNQWMVESYSPGSRAAAFFAGLGFLISQMAENVYGNAYSGGMDMAGLFPKYINIRRGCMITALLSWVVQPWLFYNTASVFVSVMASFTVFIVPLVGIMVADYFIIRKQRIELSQLYTSASDGAYWFNYGINWRCMLVWVVCFVPGMPGMIASINPSIEVGTGMNNYFRGNYIFSFFASVILYTSLMKLFPPARIGLQDDRDVYGTYTEETAEAKGIVPFQKGSAEVIVGFAEASDLAEHHIRQTDEKKGPIVTV